MAVLNSFEPVPRSTLRAHIVERLRTAILAGDIPPGAPLVETALSKRFDVSRGPLREALRQLIEEGLVVTVPYTGTHVASLSVDDVREIYSLRTALEIFAFEQIWDRRDDQFRAELVRRNDALIATIDAGDDGASILTELAFHGFVFEACGHRLLERAWLGLRGRLQLYWAAHHRAHGRRGPRRDSHDSYIAAVLGDDLGTMRTELADHMRRGAAITENFLHTLQPSSSGKAKRGDKS